MRCGLLAVVGLVASWGAFAITPSFQAYSNGSMMYAFPYSSTRTGVSVQVKTADETDWHTVAGVYGKWGNSYATWVCKTNFPGKLSVRIAAVTADGVGEYDAAPDLSATRALPALPLNGADAPLDGYFNHTDATWAGLDLGAVVKITKIRYSFRFDASWASRWNGSKFQIAADSTFTSPQDVHTVSSATYTSSTLHEVAFDPPLETRYIRHIAAQYSSLNELEVIGEDGGAAPVAFPRFDLGNTNNLCQWATSDFADSASNCLERSRFSTGPWTAVSGWRKPGEVRAFEDLTAKVGIEYWYRVRSVTSDGTVETSVPVSHRRLRGLDRDPGDLAHLRSGVTLYASNVGNAFDGSRSTFADVQPKNVAVGCNFGEKCYLAAAVYLGRPSSDRPVGACLYGSNDVDSPMSDPDKLSIGFILDAQKQGYTEVPFPARQGYQVLYASKGEWYGNLCEINFFGWSESDIEAAGLPRYPTVITAENGEATGVVDLAWSGGLHLESYDVQYRKKGDGAWTTFADGLPAESESCSVTGLQDGTNYEFRVIGYSSDESGFSPIATCFVYQLVPGSGTGLKAVVYGAADRDHVALSPTVEKSVWSTAEIDQDGGSLFTNAAHTTALVTLHGKLIVPLTGKYTFTFETKGTDGQAFWLDGTECVNVGVSSGIRRYATSLAAGEHPIVLVYRSNNTRKYLHFGWELDSVWSERAVPRSQLVPADESAYTDYTAADSDGWQISMPPSTSSKLSYFRWNADGSFYVRGDGSDYNWNFLTLLTREESGAFDFSFTVKSSEMSGRTCLFVTDEKGAKEQSISFIYTGSNFGMKGNSGDLISPAWPSAWSGTTKFRLVREPDRTLTFYVKNGVYGNLSDEADWRAFRTLPQGLWTEKGIDLSGRRLRIGFNQFYDANSHATVRDIKIRRSQGSLIFIR